MNKNPLVSVVLPVRNNEKTITTAINSVLNQSYRELELIVVLNGCTDNTEILVSTIEDARLKIIESNIGVVPAMNAGLRACSGRYIARQDGDDFWLPSKLKNQMEKLLSQPSIDILGTQMLVRSADGGEEMTNYPIEDADCKKWLMQAMNPIGNPTVVYKADVLEKVGGYWEMYPLAEDMDFFFRCSPHYSMFNLSTVEVVYNHVHKINYDSRVPRLMAQAYNHVFDNLDFFKKQKF